MKRALLIGVVGLLLLAAALRFHSLEVQSFWNDEGNSARLSERSVTAIIEGTASDVHPPLYYLLLRGWRELVGETEFGLRSLSAFAGVLTVAVTIALARRAAAAGLVLAGAGLLAAISPVLIYYSQETRMYALLALLAALSTWVLGIWLVRPRRRFAAAYVVLIAAGLYTHYFFPAVVAAQGLVVLLAATRPPSGTLRLAIPLAWGVLIAVAGLLYLPWVPIFLRQIGGREGGAIGLIDYLAQTTRWLALGSTVRAGQWSWAIGALGLLILVGIVVGRGRALPPLVMVAVPLGFSFMVGATDPAFFKFLVVVVPFLAVLGGLAFGRWGGTGRPMTALSGVAAALLLVYGAGSVGSLRNLYADPAYARADYRGMAARIAAEAHPNAGIILNAPNQWEAFTYYHRDGAPVYPLPRGRPDPALLEPEVERITAAHDRIYAIFWGEAQRDPERIVERWLDAHAYKATDEWVGDVRFVVYAVPRGDAADHVAPVGAVFRTPAGQAIRLAAAGVWPSAVSSGDIVQVQLQWVVDEPIDQPYKVFLHLVDAAGQLVAQRDGEPVGGARPTTTWVPGETIIDNHGLPVPYAAAAGRYRLLLGLYDAYDPSARLPVQTTNGQSDSIELAVIDVR